jgi:hypothetical protein
MPSLLSTGAADDHNVSDVRGARGRRSADRAHVLSDLRRLEEPHQPDDGQSQSDEDSERDLRAHGGAVGVLLLLRCRRSFQSEVHQEPGRLTGRTSFTIRRIGSGSVERAVQGSVVGVLWQLAKL